MATLELSDGTTTVSFLTGTLKLRHGGWNAAGPAWQQGWTPQGYGGRYAFERYAPMVETLPLVGQGTGDNLRDAVYAIELLMEKARLSTDNLLGLYVYLKAAGENEGSTRQSLIYGGKLDILSRGAADPLLTGGRIEALLTLYRHPLWESQYAGDSATMDALGGKLALTGGKGTAPGRISRLSIYQDSAAATGPDRFWVGIRYLTPGYTSFKPLWECEVGFAVTDAAATRTAGDDASPADSGNNKIRVTYATTGLTKRLLMTVGQVYGSNYLHAVGRYLVLCRCKVSAGESGVQLRYGVNGAADATFAQCESMIVDNTAWRLIPLGEVTIPATGVDATGFDADDAYYTELQIWTEQISGSSTTLDLDTLTFIPSDHMVSFEGAALAASSGSYAYVDTLPNDTVIGFNDLLAAGARRPLVDLGSVDWYYPASGGLLVAAGERATSSVLADDVWVGVVGFDRWLTVTDT